jgi:hypothetical protein
VAVAIVSSSLGEHSRKGTPVREGKQEWEWRGQRRQNADKIATETQRHRAKQGWTDEKIRREARMEGEDRNGTQPLFLKMYGKYRTYRRVFWMCGKERSFGIFADERELGGMPEGLQKKACLPRSNITISLIYCQRAVLTESDEVLRRRSHAGAQRCSWSKAHRSASPTRAARRLSALNEEPHQELRALRQAADLNMVLAVYSARLPGPTSRELSPGWRGVMESGLIPGGWRLHG